MTTQRPEPKPGEVVPDSVEEANPNQCAYIFCRKHYETEAQAKKCMLGHTVVTTVVPVNTN